MTTVEQTRVNLRPFGSPLPLGTMALVTASLLGVFLVTATGKVLAAAAVRFVAGIAAYAGVAFELEGALGRTVLPTLGHHHGQRAMSGWLADQVERVAREPGVREQL